MNLRHGDFSMKAKPRGRFAVATKPIPNRVLHVVTYAWAIWTHDHWRRPARFRRMEAQMSCGRVLASVSLHIAPPERFELCNYCLAAELGIEAAAPVQLARLSAEELEQAERDLGVPASRAVRRARLEVVA